jgi:hypothetical protein
MPSCVCDAARGFEGDGDGHTCAPAAPCWHNPVVCDPNAGLSNSCSYLKKLKNYSTPLLYCSVSFEAFYGSTYVFFQSVCHLVERVMDAGTLNFINSMRL